MKGCGGKILTFIAGMLTGIVLFVGSIAGVIYYAISVPTIGDINERTANNAEISENEQLSAMSILDVILNMKEFMTSDDATIAGFEEVFGVDLVGMLDEALGGLSDTAIYVSVADVQSYDGVADSINQYIFDTETLVFEQSGTLALGGSVKVDTVASPRTVTITANEVTTVYSTRFTVSAGVVVESATGEYIKVIEGAKTRLSNASFKDLTSNFGALLDCLTLDVIFNLAGLNESTLPLLADRSSLPVTMALNEIIEIFNDIDGITIGELQNHLGITFDGEIFESLQNTPIGEIGNEINSLTFAQIIPDLDRDLYVKVSDVSGTLPATVMSYYNSIVNISELTEADALASGVNINKTGSVLSFYEEATTTWVDIDTAVTYSISGDRLVETPGGVYYKAHIGTSTEVLKALADASLNTMDSKIDNLLLGEVMEINETSPSLLISLQNTKINELGNVINTLTLSEVIDIYEEDVYTLADGTEPSGTVYYQNDGTVAEPVWSPYVSGDRYYISQAKSAQVLIGLKDSNINNLSEGIDALTLAEVIDIDQDEYRQVGSTLGITEYYARVGVEGSYTFEPYDEAVHGVIAVADRWYLYHEGTSHVVLKKMAGITIGNLGSQMTTVINDIKLNEIVTIYEEDIYTLADGTEPSGTSYYKNLGTVETPIWAPWVTGDLEARYYISTEKSSIVLIKMKDLKIGEIGTDMQGIIDDIEVGELIQLTDDVYVQHPYDYTNPAQPGLRYYKLLPTGEYVRWVHDPDYTNQVDKYELVVVGSANILQELSGVKIGNLATEMKTVIDDLQFYDVLDIDRDLYRVATEAEITAGTEIFVLQSETGEADSYDVYVEYDPANANHTAATTPKYYRYYEGASAGLIKKIAYVRIADIENTMSYAIDNTTIADLGLSASGIMLEASIQNSKLKDLDEAITATISNASVADIIDWGEITGVDPDVQAILSGVTAQDFFSGLDIVKPDSLDPTTWYIAYDPV